MNAMVEFFAELDLLAPADPASTRRAINQVGLTQGSMVVDAGCGTGRQTLQLLDESPAAITATDIESTLLDRLLAKARAQGYAERLKVQAADMLSLPFEPCTLDLIYSEGSIYNIGYETGLKAWLPLLKPHGHVCVTDAAFTDSNPPAAVQQFWAAEYPGITTAGRMEQLARDCGYAVLDGFWMPKAGWEAYYAPVERRLEELLPSWESDPVRAQVLEAIRREIDLFRRYGDSYGYYFVVLQNGTA